MGKMLEKEKLITKILLFQLQEVQYIFKKSRLEEMSMLELFNIISDINNNQIITKESYK